MLTFTLASARPVYRGQAEAPGSFPGPPPPGCTACGAPSGHLLLCQVGILELARFYIQPGRETIVRRIYNTLGAAYLTPEQECLQAARHYRACLGRACLEGQHWEQVAQAITTLRGDHGRLPALPVATPPGPAGAPPAPAGPGSDRLRRDAAA